MELRINKFIISIITVFITIFFYSGCGNEIKPGEIALHIPENSADHDRMSGFPPSQYGYLIYDISEQKVIKAHNSKKSFIPASVTKLFTSIYALENFKDKESYITEIAYSGKIKKGEIQGNLYLKGSGDPTLSISELVELVKQLRANGIKTVQGGFFYDESLFPKKEVIDENMSPEARYNTGLSALSLNNNLVYSVQLKDNDGRVTGYNFMPSTPLHKASWYSGSSAYRPVRYSSNSDRETWSFPEKRTIPRQLLPVKDPALFTAGAFKQICKIHGITIPDPEPGTAPKESKKLIFSESDEISSIIKEMLHNSNNTAAELIAITSIIKATGEYKASMEPLENFYKEQFNQIEWSDFYLKNGSGLTPSGRVTPEQTAAILIYAEKKKLHGKEADYYLPLSGFEGTMTSRMDTPSTAMRVYAKTGNIFFASALTGFFYAASGKKYIFSVFISDIEKRNAYDKGGQSQIYEAVLWGTRAMNAIDRFIADNIKML